MIILFFLIQIVEVSINNKLFAITQDSSAINELLTKCKKAQRKKPLLAISYGKECIKQSLKSNYLEKIPETYATLGFAYDRISNYDSSIYYFKQASIIYNLLGYPIKEANCYIDLSSEYIDKADFTSAIFYINKIITIAQELNDLRLFSKAYTNLGAIYINMNEYDLAIHYTKKSLEIKKILHDQHRVFRSYRSLGSYYTNKKLYDSAHIYYDSALVIAYSQKDTSGIANIFSYKAETYFNQGIYNNAATYIDKSIYLYEKLKKKNEIKSFYLLWTRIYLKNKDYTSAIEYANKSLLTNKEIDEIADAYHYLSIAYDSLKEYKTSLKFFSLYKFYEDSIMNINKSNQIIKMATYYEDERKQKQIEINQAEIEKANAEIKREKAEKIMMYIFLGIIILLVIISYLINRQKNLKLLQNTIQENEKRKSLILEEEKRKVEAQYLALKYQVNPEFLINTFNSFLSITEKIPAESAKFIEELSNVYRYILQSQDIISISLSKEIESINSYIYIIKKKVPENLSVEIKINIELDEYYIVPLSLQTIIEYLFNYHSAADPYKKLFIFIETTHDKYITIKSNIHNENLTSIILEDTVIKNLIKRCEFMSDKKVIIDTVQNYFVIKIPLTSKN